MQYFIPHVGRIMLNKLLGSRLRAQVIGWLFTHSDERFYVRELTSLLGEDSTNLSRELARLEKLGLVLSEEEGKQKYYRANPDSAIFEELKGLALKTTGLVDVLREALASLDEGIELAFVFGSQAKGTADWRSDVDLLIVGDVKEATLHSAISAAEARLHRTVNYTLLAPREFRRRRAEKGNFLAHILKASKLMVKGSADVL